MIVQGLHEALKISIGSGYKSEIIKMGNVDLCLSSWLNLTQTLRLSEGSDWHTPSLGGRAAVMAKGTHMSIDALSND